MTKREALQNEFNITSIKLSAEFGVDFRGCEEKAKDLFRKINENKQLNRETQRIVKKKGLKELKGFEIENKFWSYGSRSKGGYLPITNR